MKKLRKNLRGFRAGGGSGLEVGGGGGGVKGTFCGGIVDSDKGVVGEEVGPVTVELDEVFTGPGGGGSGVLALADPGRTAGLGLLMLGLLMSA